MGSFYTGGGGSSRRGHDVKSRLFPGLTHIIPKKLREERAKKGKLYTKESRRYDNEGIWVPEKIYSELNR